MGEALYRPILKQAWQIIKSSKALWFFGLFAAIISTSGEYEILSRAFYHPGNQPGIITNTISAWQAGLQNGLSNGGSFFSNLWSATVASPGSLIITILLFIIALAIFAFFIWLSTISQIGLIKNTNLVNKGEKPTINQGIDSAVPHFWPILSINVVLKAIIFALFMILGQEFVLLTDQGLAGSILYYLSFIIFVVAVLSISFMIRYQIFYILLKSQTVKEAMDSAWELFKDNWLVSLEMAFLLFIIYLIAAFVSSLVVALFSAVPFVIIIYYQWPIWLAISVSVVGLLIMLASIFLITALLTSFQWTTWTLLFKKLTGQTGGDSKIIRGADALMAKIKK